MRPLKENQTKDSSLAPESRVAARLGLTRVMCAALRRDQLTPRVDYVIDGRRVMITDAGYVALRGLLGCPESPEEEKARLSQSVREPEPISLRLRCFFRKVPDFCHVYLHKLGLT